MEVYDFSVTVPKGETTILPETKDVWNEFSLLQQDLAQIKDEFGKVEPARRHLLNHATDFHKQLVSTVIQMFQGEAVTRAWIKMHEILSFSHVVETLFDSVSTEKKRRPLAIFCNAELPGSFVSCIHHYIQMHPKRTKRWCWDWIASSYIGTSTCLEDKFGLWKKYPGKWLQNQTMNGDVTDPSNLLSMEIEVGKRFPQGIDLFTSDAGIDVDGSGKFNAQEEQTSLVHLGQTLLGWLVTRSGGSMIIKQYTFHTPFTCFLLCFLQTKFRKCLILKPESSKRLNSEIYLQLEGFVKLTEEERSYWFSMLQFCRESKGFPTQLKIQCLNGSVLSIPEWDRTTARKLYTIAQKLQQTQVAALKEFVALAQTLTSPMQVRSMKTVMMEKQIRSNQMFLFQYPIQILTSNYLVGKNDMIQEKKKRTWQSRKRRENPY